jgi:phosphoribosylglycinamide formyltransferase-1
MNQVVSPGPLRLGIITYDHPHLKTEQLVQRLLFGAMVRKAAIDIKILALPFSPRLARAVLLQHRPDQDLSISTRELAEFHKLDFCTCTYDDIPDVADYYIVGGAGILKAAALGRKKIINAHPGIIPLARGLDAFKWSILNCLPLGVTLHYIDAEVDAGETIAVVRTPVFRSDSIEVLARRHYELELDLLGDFQFFLSSAGATSNTLAYPEGEPKMRMPIETEQKMIAGFDEYKRKFAGSASGNV